jgi:hypothetical protein
MMAPPEHKIVRVHRYDALDGSPLYETVRYEPKKFRQRHIDDRGGHTWKLDGIERVPYRLPQLRQGIDRGDTPFVVEGEKDADSLERLGFCATTNAGGAAWAWTPQFVEHFRGAKPIVVIADCDAPGRKAAAARSELLRSVCADVRVIDLAPDRVDGYDVSDWIADGHAPGELLALVEAATPEATASNAPAIADPPTGLRAAKIVTTDWSNVRIEPVNWLMPDRLPFAELTIVEGEGGLGKTTAVLDLAARISTGRPMPDGTPVESSDVVLVAEEDRVSILKARLQAAGADLARIHHVSSVGDDRFSLPSHSRALDDFVAAKGARFVVIDAIFNHIDAGLKIAAAEDVRRMLVPLTEIAHDTGAAIVGIRHWGKTPRNAVMRGLGSVDITNLSRSVLAIARHPADDQTRVVAAVKSNLGEDVANVRALTFTIESETIADDVKPDSSVRVGRICWGLEAEISADDLAHAGDETGEKRTIIAACVESISEKLADGPRPSKDVREELTREKYSMPTIQRAREKAGVEVTPMGGFPRTTMWNLARAHAHDRKNDDDTDSSDTTEGSSLSSLSIIAPTRARAPETAASFADVEGAEW